MSQPPMLNLQNQQQQRYMTGGGMPSPSLNQGGNNPMAAAMMMGGGGGGPGGPGGPPLVGPGGTRLPFGPPLGSTDPSGQKSHHDILRKHQEAQALKDSGRIAVQQANLISPGMYLGMSSKHNNSIIPILPRIPNPNQ